MVRPLILAFSLVASTPFLFAACAGSPGDAAPADPAVPARAHVSDLDAFAAFIATHPTPADFRAKYPGVALALPGDITTKELRTDNSRYFAELDADGHITGGRFQ